MVDGTQIGSGEGDDTSGSGTPDTGSQTDTGNNGSDAGDKSQTFSWDGLQLDEGTRSWIDKKGLKDVQGLAQTAMNAEQLQGDSIRMPGENATDEDWNKFHEKMAGKYLPEESGGYEFAMPEGLADDFPYSEESATQFKSWAHEAKLTPQQANALHGKYVQQQNEMLLADRDKAGQQVDAATTALEKEWGADLDSDEYKAKLEFADRALNGLPHGKELREALYRRGVFTQEGYLTEPSIAIALANVGEAMFKEGNNPQDTGQVKEDVPIEERLYGKTTPSKRS